MPLSYAIFDGPSSDPPLVFLHGLFGSKSNFSSLVKKLVLQTGRKVGKKRSIISQGGGSYWPKMRSQEPDFYIEYCSQKFFPRILSNWTEHSKILVNLPQVIHSFLCFLWSSKFNNRKSLFFLMSLAAASSCHCLINNLKRSDVIKIVLQRRTREVHIYKKRRTLIKNKVFNHKAHIIIS